MGAKTRPSRNNRLVVRSLQKSDIRAVQELQRQCFPNIEPWARDQLEKQIERFPEGQLGVELDGKLVATSSSLIVDGDDYRADHTFVQVSDDGYLGTHVPEGDSLYGIDIAVHPRYRGYRLARRLYEARKDLVRARNLRGILIAGRMPEFHRQPESMSGEEYVQEVQAKHIRDNVIRAQLANGFAIRRVLRNYLSADKESRGHAALMEWLNPSYSPPNRRSLPPRRVRVATVQYQMRSIASFDEFATQCEFFTDTAAEYRCDFLLYPELLTNQLLSLVPAARPEQSARLLHKFTQQYVDFFGHMALKYSVNIIAGTHLTVENDTLYNIAYLFRRDGSMDKQYKIHITPSESRWWGVNPGDRLHVFDTDRGKIAICICYDIEFPELARIARAQGANIIFVPYNTDIRSGHLRVRSCAQARCIENHVYCVLSGAVGNLPFVEGADIHYAQACILTPSDIPFARDGVASEATPNVETMLLHDLDLETLQRTLRNGTVRPWMDRRQDVYKLIYHDDAGSDHEV